jgi:hypothetical protein
MADDETEFAPIIPDFPFGNTGRVVAGGALVLIGVAGLALPLLPGWALIIPGLGIMAPAVPFLRPLHVRVIGLYRRFTGEYGPHPDEAT